MNSSRAGTTGVQRSTREIERQTVRSERFEKRSIPYYIPVVGASIPSPAIPSPDPAGVGPQSYSSWGAQFGISLPPPVRRSKKRDAAVKVAGDPVLLEEATSALRDLTGNEGSTKAASARLSTYAQIVSAAGLVPFPTSQSAVMCYLAAAVAAKYKNIEPTVSDVLGSPDAPPDVAPSANAVFHVVPALHCPTNGRLCSTMRSWNYRSPALNKRN